jgi:small subunit ribosomal protein S3
MGRKVHPYGFRLGVINDWRARWYADKNYAEFLNEDLKLRKAIAQRYPDAGVTMVEIERQAAEVTVSVHTARPGIVIGRGGQRVDETRGMLEKLIGKKIRINIREVQQAELDAFLVARSVADQLERRIAHRRAMKQAIFRTMQAGAKGIRIVCSGRLGGSEIARNEKMSQGRVPLQTLRADIDYGLAEARTVMGRIGVKAWIYKGDILPEREEMDFEAPPIPADIEDETAEAEAVVTEAAAVEAVAEPAAIAESVVAAEPAVATEPEAAVETEVAEEKPAPAKAAAKPRKKAVAKPKAEAEAVTEAVPEAVAEAAAEDTAPETAEGETEVKDATAEES